MNWAFRFILTAVFLLVGSMPEFIVSDVSGVREIQVIHNHDKADHSHERTHESKVTGHNYHHHHEDQASDQAQESSDSHTHEILLVGIQALVANASDIFGSTYQIIKFPFPRDLPTPLSWNLGSIFRPPIVA